MAIGEAGKQIGKLVKNVSTGIFNRTLGRLLGSGISTDSRLVFAKAKWSGRSDKKDWRVRLQVPEGPLTQFFDFDKNPLLQPLAGSRGMFWPLTPSIVIQHSANYNAMAQIHSNYPFQAYQNSQVDSMNIIGEFPVQNSEDAKHWVATVNFLRTATKMFFGKDEGTGKGLKGNPPPILHLSGYGDHMFSKVPVVLNSFNVELRAGIDYISTKQGVVYNTNEIARSPHQQGASDYDQTWAPTLSNISVLVTPVYSRDSVKNFSLSEFARGGLTRAKGSGDIGFI